MGRIRPCLWYDGEAQQAAEFYAATFADSAVTAIRRAPGDYPAGRQGDVLVVEFTVCGMAFLAMNGGAGVQPTMAVSFQIDTESQGETDRYWDAIVGNGGEENDCGWCRDRWGYSWQITPRVLSEAIASTDPATARRAFDAMMTMRRIDHATIEAAVRGGN